MSHQSDNLPLGKLLQSAGLISSTQLQQALEFQSQYSGMKLGEILVLQEIISPQTIDFFVNRWRKITQEGKNMPLGYYLQQAYLLNKEQINNILQEQKTKQFKFGELAVQKGFISQKTINFFLDSFSVKFSNLMSLIDLESYNQKQLFLDKKYTNSSLILSRILAWTGGNPVLTKSIAQVFAQSNLNINPGDEIKTVDRLIELALIKNWQTSDLGAQIRSIKENIMNNSRSQSISLLNEYQDILLSGSKPYEQLQEQDELLNLGLVILDGGNLRITNLIYQQVFNQNWLAQTRKLIENKIKNFPPEPTLANPLETNLLPEQKTQLAQTNYNLTHNKKSSKKTTEPIARFSALFTLTAIVLLVPLILAVNNYYSNLQKQSQPTSNNLSESEKLAKFCDQVNLADSTAYLSLIYQLEQNKQTFLNSFPINLEIFPNNCETLLNKLRILAIPQLGKQNRVIEAIKHLCKIPANSDSINEATVWLERWYNSSVWSQETQSYLTLIRDCPAGDRSNRIKLD